MAATLADINKISRHFGGFLSDGTDDPYSTERALSATLARDWVVAEMGTVALPQTEQAVAIVSGQREYDLASYGFYSVSSVRYGTSTNRALLYPYDREVALAFQGNNPNTTGTPAYFYYDGGSTIGIVPASTDTAKTLYVTGSKMLSAMTVDGSTTGLSPVFDQAIGLRAAYEIAAMHDEERPENKQRAPALEKAADRALSTAKLLLRNSVPQRGGIVVSQAAADGMRRRR